MHVRNSRFLSLLLIIVSGSIATANDAATKAAIVRLMEVGWSVTPTARAAADAQYIELQATAANDVRLLTASTLVLLQQRRYEDANKRLDELLIQDANNILALRAKCWLTATMKSYGGSMVIAEKLRVALPAETTQDIAGETATCEHLAFLGRLCGYLAGPVADGVDQAERKLLEKTILTGLGPERRLAFEQARDGVTQKFFELTDTKIDTEKKNVEVRKVEANQTLQDVETARKEIEERANELEARATKLQKEWNDELADIARLDRPLVAELARLQARASIASRDLGNYQNQIDSLNFQFSREKDPNIRNQIGRDIDQLSFLANRVSGDLAAINRLGQGVESQRGVLAQRQAQAQTNYGGQLDRVNKELITLGKKEKRADYEEKKAKRPVSASSTRTVALSSQVTALSTYDKFPLEQARQRLLNELK